MPRLDARKVGFGGDGVVRLHQPVYGEDQFVRHHCGDGTPEYDCRHHTPVS